MRGGTYNTVTPQLLEREQLSDRCGCLAKLGPTELKCVLEGAYAEGMRRGPAAPPGDDCAELPPLDGVGLASLDFGPLVCPDPVRSGRIAALHAFSDVYASGGIPVAALAILIVDDQLSQQATTGLMAGMIEACGSEGAPLLGGHTTVGTETMAGLAVIGGTVARAVEKTVTPEATSLLVSKPIGGGLVLRAYRQGLLELDDIEEALTWMETSNREASQAAIEAGVKAMTDVTGFGLLGHLAEMLRDSGHGATIDVGRVPVLDSARNLAAALYRSPWVTRNLDYCRGVVELATFADAEMLGVLADPQTSGGLLVAADESAAEELKEAGFQEIGTITNEPRVEVTV